LSSKGSRYVIVEQINMIKKHMKPSQKIKEGGIIEREGRMHISNVSMVCPKCSKATRVGVQIGDENKMRFCKKCREIID
jgi:large subunit ribosomal protein L24